MNANLEYSIGTGANFPIELTEVNGKTSWKALTGDIRLIEQNLISIFNTQIGQLIRNEDFGNRLWELLEEPNTQTLEFLVYRFCKSAIESWEPRIEFLESSIINYSDKISISLKYKVRTDQSVTEMNFSYNKSTNTFVS